MNGSEKQPLFRIPGSKSSTKIFNIFRKKHSFSDDGFWAALKMLCFTPTFSIGTSQDGEEKEMWTHIPSQKVLGMELDL
jgi:hypothetical protein